MRKILLIFMLLIVATLPTFSQSVYAEENQVKVIVQKCNIYESASAEVIKATVTFGEILTLTDSGETEDFYQVAINKSDEIIIGYILKSFVISTTSTSLEKKLDPNARVINNDAVIYLTDSEENKFLLAGREVKLEQNQQIKIVDGYSKGKAFHKIMFEVDDEIYIGYIKTRDIAVEGITGIIVLVVFVVILVASIVLSILFTTRNKRKGKKMKLFQRKELVEKKLQEEK